MKAAKRAVVALANTELITPTKSTTKTTMRVTSAAIQAEPDASVPIVISTTPAAIRLICACSRSVIEPVKSTNSTIAIDPNEAKIPITGFPITSDANANNAGITIAARAARRVADSPASLARNHPTTEPTPATPRAYAAQHPGAGS